ncbi:YciI family protein [Leifsonia sp. NPDC080035]|uniref:YciI family protein n=1 Tax=Leifsonia sp. NPDC080035 TaxID=3143936 RepID=A0AAU7GEY1_9MICO
MPGSHPEPERRDLWVVAYGWRPEDTELVVKAYGAHRANTDRMGADGRLLMIGTTDASHAMAVFADEDAAAGFVSNDPLVGSDLVRSVSVTRWSALRYH